MRKACYTCQKFFSECWQWRRNRDRGGGQTPTNSQKTHQRRRLVYICNDGLVHHLRLVARETNFSLSFTPELALRPRHAYQFNPLVRHNSDLVRD